jgi:hypothetical protein
VFGPPQGKPSGSDIGHHHTIAPAVSRYGKGRFTGAPQIRSAILTALIGSLAARVAFMVARAIS